MSLTGLVLGYLLIALSSAWTSYFTIWRPATELFEEIVDLENTIYTGFSGFLLWTIIGTLTAPYIILMLLQGNNIKIINQLAFDLSQRAEDDDSE